MLLIVFWFSCCHTSQHPQIICCKSENSLSQWHGKWLSKGSGWVPPLHGEMKKEMMEHLRPAFQTNQNSAQWQTWCSAMQCHKEFETAGSKCGASAETKKAQEHQRELWTTWLSCKQRGRGQGTGNELKHCLHILKASGECRAPWLNCYWLNSDRHCWTLSQQFGNGKVGGTTCARVLGVIPNRQRVMEGDELQYLCMGVRSCKF